ncbi:TPA: segregation/condensation protein A [Candidatus Galligastranaerophilus intestinavium]|uniref:Segregation and condensation protein A n=1 Tax=Candidatus Galligastranaerophilus intestinavium TaxID=2840836 RepID=A0A9D1FIQ7_9BACT|nr:segregation/condensation protein A [Candidatus Galligastranaerophilus intestinavium]
MNNSVQDFYGNNNDILKEITNLDSTVDFSANVEYISKNGIQKDGNVDTIEILVDLARSGKIDPWNIDIVDLYDKYMERLSQLKIKNLKSIGRALLFTSILLRLKSNVIEGLSLEDLEPQEDEFFEDDGFEADYEAEQLQLPSSNVISFDEVLQRRTSVRLNRNRNVTLKDLIRHLEFYEQLEKKQSLKNALERQKRRVRDYSKLKAKDILNLAHDEYIETVVEKMRQNLEQIFKKEEKIELRELTLLGFDKSSAYIAVLFLMVKDDIDIVQEDFYGKLYVKKAQKSAEEEVAN